VNTPKVPVSILIPIKNEAANLPRCLAAVSWADEIFVVDSQSTDGSIAIAEATGAKVVQFHFNGVWPKKKNWALENLPFKHDWVFILDADEVMPPETAAEFAEIARTDGNGKTGYWVNRRFMFMGKWLKHAYYPNWNLRLLKHKLGRYEQLVVGATQSGDNEVHEHISVQGESGRLKVEMDHYAFPSVDVFVEKHNRYSNWEAALEVQDKKHEAQHLQHGATKVRRRIKQISRKMPFRPFLRFLYVYVVQGGWMDGREGYYFSKLHGFYEFLSVAKSYELRRKMVAARKES
jgi:glycosyltransferase involved in cell wall biosynthesis